MAQQTLQQLSPVPLKPQVFETQGISRRTHEEHYKLYEGYIKKYNEIMGKLDSLDPDPSTANQTFSEIRELKVELTFAIGGVKNHELYFDILGGQGGQPEGQFAGLIEQSYGSFDRWLKDARASAIAARGWVWTAYDFDFNRLFNYIGDTQNTFPVWNAVPVFAIDTYEHAYVADFGSARAKYLDAFFENVDWNVVERRLQKAMSGPNTILLQGQS